MNITKVETQQGVTTVTAIGTGEFIESGSVLYISVDHDRGAVHFACNHCIYCKATHCEHKLCPACGERVGQLVASMLRVHIALARAAWDDVSPPLEDVSSTCEGHHGHEPERLAAAAGEPPEGAGPGPRWDRAHAAGPSRQ